MQGGGPRWQRWERKFPQGRVWDAALGAAMLVVNRLHYGCGARTKRFVVLLHLLNSAS